MKVYMKKEDRDPILAKLFIYLLSFGVPALILFLIFNYEGDLLSALNYYSATLVFLGLFGILDIYLLIYLIKPKVKKTVVLESITEEQYKGGKIYYMKFGMQNKNSGKIFHDFYRCYTYESVDFKPGETFELTIKEFNDKILYLEKSDVFIEETLGEESTIANTPRVKIATLIFFIPFLIPSFICFHALYNNPEFWYIYLPVGLIAAAIPLSVLFLSRKDNENK